MDLPHGSARAVSSLMAALVAVVVVGGKTVVVAVVGVGSEAVVGPECSAGIADWRIVVETFAELASVGRLLVAADGGQLSSAVVAAS